MRQNRLFRGLNDDELIFPLENVLQRLSTIPANGFIDPARQRLQQTSEVNVGIEGQPQFGNEAAAPVVRRQQKLLRNIPGQMEWNADNNTQSEPVPASASILSDKTAEQPLLPVPADYTQAQINPDEMVSSPIVEPPVTNRASRLLRPASQQIFEDWQNTNLDNTPREGSFKKRLGRGLFRGLQLWAESGGQGGLAGLAGAVAAGGAASGASKQFEAGLRVNDRRNKLLREYNAARQNEEWQSAQDLKRTQTQTIINDDRRADEKYISDASLRRDEYNRKVAKDAQDAENDRLDRIDKKTKLLADAVNRSSVFDPADPKNAEIVKDLKAAGIPVIAKTANQDVKYFQDERSGAWFISTTDKKSGANSTRPIMAGGKQLVTTPKLVVSGENSARIAEINQAGQTARNDANIQGRKDVADSNNEIRIQIAGRAKSGGATALIGKLSDYAKKNFKTLEQAKDDFKAAGIPVDEILQQK